MNKEVIQSEVTQVEASLLTALREGELLKGVSMHLDSPDYRNIWISKKAANLPLEAPDRDASAFWALQEKP